MSIMPNSQLSQIEMHQNSIFNQHLDSYETVYSDLDQSSLIISEYKEEGLEELIPDGLNINATELEHDMAMCRYFEGEK